MDVIVFDSDAAVQHPAIDQCVAEVIRQCIGEHRREALVGLNRQVRKEEGPIVRSGHVKGGGLDAACPKLRGVPENIKSICWIECYDAHALAPQEHLNVSDMCVP